jgi:hypothetical protein
MFITEPWSDSGGDGMSNKAELISQNQDNQAVLLGQLETCKTPEDIEAVSNVATDQSAYSPISTAPMPASPLPVADFALKEAVSHCDDFEDKGRPESPRGVADRFNDDEIHEAESGPRNQ